MNLLIHGFWNEVKKTFKNILFVVIWNDFLFLLYPDLWPFILQLTPIELFLVPASAPCLM